MASLNTLSEIKDLIDFHVQCLKLRFFIKKYERGTCIILSISHFLKIYSIFLLLKF